MKIIRDIFTALTLSMRLTSIRHILTLLSAMVSLTLCATTPQLSLTVAPDRSRIYLGESFNLHITVNGADSGLTPPDISTLSATAETTYLGSQSQSRRSVSLINGQFRQESTLSRLFVYQIRPHNEGLFETGPVVLHHEGRTLGATGRQVTVTGVTQQTTVLGTLTASTTAALVDQPFTISLKLAIAPLPPPYQNIEPLHANQPPHLNAEYLNIADIQGLHLPDLNAILSNLARAATARTPAFHINDYQRSGIDMSDPFNFDMGFSPRPIRFRLEPTRETINNINYWIYSLDLNYTPQNEGDFTFGPLTFKGSVLTGVTSDQRGVFTEVFAVAPAVTVRVTPPPEEGRPDHFIGTVGRNFKANATLDTTTCKVGDPLNLTLDITGDISLSNLRPPLLALQEELNHDCRIYHDSVATSTIDNGKRFVWQLRPIHAGTLEFPPIKLAWYDTDNHTYVTTATEPIPVQARPTTQVVSDLPDATSSTNGSNSPDSPRPAAITLNTTPTPPLPSPRLTWLLLLTTPALFLITLVIRTIWRSRHLLRHTLRRNSAAAMARRRLTTDTSPTAISTTLRSYLAARLNVTGHTLTPPEVARLLTNCGAPDSLATSWQSILEQLDETLYRPTTPTPDTTSAVTTKQATKLITTTENTLSRRPRRRTTTLTLIALLTLITTTAGTPPDTPTTTGHATALTTYTFAWEEANSRMASARTATDFHQAALAYHRLVLNGHASGPLFLDPATALLLSGDGTTAAAALARAERYTGATSASRTNLRLAYGLIDSIAPDFSPQALPPASPPLWTHTAFFWHFDSPCRHRLTLALVGWALLWLALTIRLISPLLAKPLIYASLLLTLICGASSAVTLLQEYHDTRTWSTRHPIPPHP